MSLTGYTPEKRKISRRIQDLQTRRNYHKKLIKSLEQEIEDLRKEL